ncbi:MAG: helix-turn-helix domain-containing protein [Verrucomicrobiae bacterium]
MTREEFQKTIQGWRVKKGFTQQDAADHLGISVRTLQNWEIARNMPNGYGLKALLAELKKR